MSPDEVRKQASSVFLASANRVVDLYVYPQIKTAAESGDSHIYFKFFPTKEINNAVTDRVVRLLEDNGYKVSYCFSDRCPPDVQFIKYNGGIK